VSTEMSLDGFAKYRTAESHNSTTAAAVPDGHAGGSTTHWK
jgi:hypothetical protein